MQQLLLTFALLAGCAGDSGCQGGSLDSSSAAQGTRYWGPPRAADLSEDPDVVEVHLTAALARLDLGVGEPTEVWAYEGLVPGPLIEATEGQTLRVIFDNELPEGADTTIHWHGLRVPNAMDGVALVQSPVKPGEQFVYEYTVPDPGTFWYHPHIRSNEQVERGLHGPMLLRERDELEVDVERFFVLDDVDLQPNGALAPFDLEEGWLDAEFGRMGNVILVNGQNVDEEPLTDAVVGGGVERWRLVNAANARTMFVEVEGADWRLIAQDGTLLMEPQSAERVRLGSGQRVDLEVLPGERPVSLTLLTNSQSAEPRLQSQVIFEGSPAPAATQAEPLEWPGLELAEPLPIEQEVEFIFGGGVSGQDVEWTINGVSWPHCEEEPPEELDRVAAGVPSRITVVNETDYLHPFHMHGNFFELLTRDGVAPAYRARLDTVVVAEKETVELYTDFSNPGLWMTHCHILEHAAKGMMTAIDVREGG